MGFPSGSVGKESACNSETQVRSLGQEDTLEKGMATHSNILAWRIAWTEETGRLWSIGSQKSQARLKRLSTHEQNLKTINRTRTLIFAEVET